MFINHLLPAVALKDYDKAVKSADHAAHLKTICQKTVTGCPCWRSAPSILSCKFNSLRTINSS